MVFSVQGHHEEGGDILVLAEGCQAVQAGKITYFLLGKILHFDFRWSVVQILDSHDKTLIRAKLL